MYQPGQRVLVRLLGTQAPIRGTVVTRYEHRGVVSGYMVRINRVCTIYVPDEKWITDKTADGNAA